MPWNNRNWQQLWQSGTGALWTEPLTWGSEPACVSIPSFMGSYKPVCTKQDVTNWNEMCFLTYKWGKASNRTVEWFNTAFLSPPHNLPLWSHSCCGVESSAIEGAFISSRWDQYLAWSKPFFICTKRSPFLTHSTLMAPFTPLSAPSPGSTMSASLSPRFAHADFYLPRSSRRAESLLLPISEVAEWLVPLICTLPFSPPHTGYFFPLAHFSDVTKVIQCLCHWTPHSFLQKSGPVVGRIYKSLSAAEWLRWQS